MKFQINSIITILAVVGVGFLIERIIDMPDNLVWICLILLPFTLFIWFWLNRK